MQVKRSIIFFLIFLSVVVIFQLVNHFYHPFSVNYLPNEQYDKTRNQYFNQTMKFMELPNKFIVSCSENVSVVIFVPCQTKETNLRNIIRHTWGQWTSSNYSFNLSPNHLPVPYHSQTIKLFFVLGSKTTEEDDINAELRFLQNESHYNDIMFFPGLMDTYMNLTLKSLTSFNQAMKSCPRATFFVKADTDVFVNIPMLMDFCNTRFVEARNKAVIFGNKQQKAAVVRDINSKWYIPEKKYPKSYFPDYVTGCGYILTKNAIKNVINNAQKAEDLFAWEDVAVTGIYSDNVAVVDTKLFRYENFGDSLDSCYMKTIIVAHRVTPQKMSSLWNEIVSNSTQCPFDVIRYFDRLIQSLIKA